MMEGGKHENQPGTSGVTTKAISQELPKALSALLQPTSPQGQDLGHQPKRNAETGPLNLEQLQVEVRDLRVQLEQMKSQHNKEIKLLMNELDEEKKVRLNLQMELQRIKKRMSKQSSEKK